MNELLLISYMPPCLLFAACFRNGIRISIVLPSVARLGLKTGM